MYIIMEFCQGGDLSRFIKKNGKLDEETTRKFMTQLGNASSDLKKSFNFLQTLITPF